MNFFKQHHLIFGARTLIAILVFGLVATVTLIVVDGRRAIGAVPTVADMQVDLNAVVATINAVNTTVNTQVAQTASAQTQVISTAVTQALTTAGVSPTTLASAASLNTGTASTFITTAVNQAVVAGQASLSQVTSVTSLTSADMTNLASTAINEGIAAGTIKTTQLQNVSTLSVSEITALVSSAVGDAKDWGVNLTAAQQAATIANAVTSIQSHAGVFDINTFKNIVGAEMVSATGLSSSAGFPPMLGPTTISAFTSTVQTELQQAALSQINSLAGVVDISSAQSAIASGVVGATGLGSAGAIVGSLGVGTQGAFTSAVQGAIVSQTLAALGGMGTINPTLLQNQIATNLAGLTGFGTIPGITGSLTSVDTTAVTALIQNSIIANTLAGLPGLPSLTTANIEALIASNIQALTGTGNVAAISGMINNDITNAIGSIAGVQAEFTNTLLQLQLFAAGDAIKTLNNFLSLKADTLSTATLTSLNGVIAGIQSLATGMLSNLSVTGVDVGALSSVATSILGSGVASAADLSNLTAILSGVTGDLSGLLGKLSSITTATTGVGGMSTTLKTSFLSSAFPPFGGLVTFVEFCSCSENWKLTVSPPRGGIFMYQPGATFVYSYYMIPKMGTWLLGLYTSPIMCVKLIGKFCVTDGAYPMILMTGTSM